MKHQKINYNNSVGKSYQLSFNALDEALADLLLVCFNGLGRAAATSSAMSLTFVSVAWPKVFLHSGHAVISSSGDDCVRILAASTAINDLLADESVRLPRLPPQQSDILPS